MCCEAGALDMMRYLHSQGARLDVADIDGRTVLHWLCMHGQTDALAWLQSTGADMGEIEVSFAVVDALFTMYCLQPVSMAAGRADWYTPRSKAILQRQPSCYPTTPQSTCKTVMESAHYIGLP
jgi:hypothetical protein